ncbi:MAG: ABC1 kinase family protein, partial [Rhodobacterales bacterium]
SVLVANWGADFLKQFRKFDVHPIAAASIGQVHRAVTRDGRDLAIKVQYPGVRGSIDSDLRNVASLLRLSGLLPRDLDIAPMLEEARRQLHEEADYQREGRALSDFGRLLENDQAFLVPALHGDLTTTDILAMDYVSGEPIETLKEAPQEVRDHVTTQLLTLLLQELFTFQLMQTDPNFANYRYQEDTGRIVLLDFGATRSFAPQLAQKFHHLLRAGLHKDRAGIRAAAIDIGYFSHSTAEHHQTQLLDMMEMALEPLTCPGTFDFGDSTLPARLREAGMAFGENRDFWEIPPMDTLFLQRKIGGLYLLATRLHARVDMPSLLAPHL